VGAPMIYAICIGLLACLAPSIAGLIYFAKRALDLSRGEADAKVVATKREGDLALADRKVDDANDAALTADAARKKAQERGDVLEGELGNASNVSDPDAAAERMRLREVEVDVGDSRQ
jgi:hypothetical protein